MRWGVRSEGYSDGRLTGVQPEPETSDRVSGSDSDTRSGRYRGQSGAWAAGATQGQLLNFTFYNTLHHAIGARIGLKRIQQQHCKEKVLVFSQSYESWVTCTTREILAMAWRMFMSETGGGVLFPERINIAICCPTLDSTGHGKKTWKFWLLQRIVNNFCCLGRTNNEVRRKKLSQQSNLIMKMEIHQSCQKIIS